MAIRELQPILNHGLAASAVALVGAGLITLCKAILPASHADQLLAIEQFVAVGAASLFAANTLLLLAVRVFRNIRAEIVGSQGPAKSTAPPSTDVGASP